MDKAGLKSADREAAGIREMDELFRRTDFAADMPGLEARIWLRIWAKMPEYELSEDELEEMAAAGNPNYHRMLLRKRE